jgi:hypothetical protein
MPRYTTQVFFVFVVDFFSVLVRFVILWYFTWVGQFDQ